MILIFVFGHPDIRIKKKCENGVNKMESLNICSQNRFGPQLRWGKFPV